MECEYVQALYSFHPLSTPSTSAAAASAMEACLDFKVGQWIRIINRDASGWFDGEVSDRSDGEDEEYVSAVKGKRKKFKRGWFPSNYVGEPIWRRVTGEEEVVEELHLVRKSTAKRQSPPPSPTLSEATRQNSLASEYSTNSRLSHQPSTSSLASNSTFTSVSTTFSSGVTPTPLTSLLPPLQKALSSLRSQAFSTLSSPIPIPSTPGSIYHARVSTLIASIRNILQQTGCLTRDGIREATASLSQESIDSLSQKRKEVIDGISALFEAAKKAGRGKASGDKEAPKLIREMVTLASDLLGRAEAFLIEAQRKGIGLLSERDKRIEGSPTSTRSEPIKGLVGLGVTFSDSYNVDRGKRLPRYSSLGGPNPSRLLGSRSSSAGTVPTLSSISSDANDDDAPQVAIAPLNVKKRRRRDERERRGSFESQMSHSTQFSTASTSTSPSASVSDLSHSAASTSSSGTGDSRLLRLNVKDKSVRGIVKEAEKVHDRLLSTTASFVFNVHAIGRDSHASSWVHLIDITREIIERVRELLVIVEELERRHTPHSQSLDAPNRELGVLIRTKDSLYMGTSSLVTAARTLFTAGPQSQPLSRGSSRDSTNKPLPQIPRPTTASSDSDSDEDEEKADLLQCSTTVLRCSGECVAALKLVQRATKMWNDPPHREPDSGSSLLVSTLSAWQSGQPDDDQNLQQSNQRRSKHTLSMLGRKATSLTCLRERYEMESAESHAMSRGPSSRTDTIEEEPETEREDDSQTVGTAVSPSSTQTDFAVPVKIRPPSDPYDDRDTPVPGYPQGRPRARPLSTYSYAPSDISSDAAFSSASHVQPQHDLLSPSPSVRSISLTSTESEQARRNSMGILAGPTTEFSSDTSSVHSHVLETPASSTASLLDRDYEPKEISFNASGQITGGTLRSLVERLSLHSQTIDASFASTFFLCFRLFTSPIDLVYALFDRFNLPCPQDIEADPEAFKFWLDSKATPVRLRIYNFLKTWLEMHFQPEKDSVVLHPIREFTHKYIMPLMPTAGQRLIDLSQKRAISTNKPIPKLLTKAISTEQLKGRALSQEAPLTNAPPAPVVSKSVIANLRNGGNVNVMDIDPLELARQLTIMEGRLFCAIKPEELLGQEFSKKAGNAPHVKAMSALSTRITGWIAEIILDEQDAKKRTNLLKYFIKLGDRCLQLNNFNTLMAVVAALNSSTISRLKRTWDGLSAKNKNTLESLRKATEHTRNYAQYRGRLREAAPPCLPFLGLYLTDLTFCHEGNPNFRPSPIEPGLKLINFDKYQKMSKIISDVQRFQVPYDLLEVKEVQQWISSHLNGLASGGDVGELYRRSLLLEPRADGSIPSSPNPANSGGKASDILNFNWR
ncbi:ras GEF [Atractiella rhizophila]|nr:ras GEF [Atractiella rhizophila]